MKGKTKARANMNHTYEEQIPISEMGEQVAYDVDGEGVLFTTQPTEKNASSLVGKKEQLAFPILQVYFRLRKRKAFLTF
jgi:hypothetical protein